MNSSALPKYEILVVDDEEIICRVVKHKLNEDNFQVKMLLNGQSACEVVQERDPCLVLVDINIPGHSGFDILKEIKASSPETPVAMVTGLNSPNQKQMSLDLGACDYLTKPLDWNHLRNLAYLCSFLKETKGNKTFE